MWNNSVRQIHRWLSIAFTVTVIANFIALAQGGGDASALGDLLAAAPTRLAPVHRSVPVRAAVCHQVAPQVRSEHNGLQDDGCAREERNATMSSFCVVK